MGNSFLPPTKRTAKLRQDLLDDGDRVGHLFSCVELNHRDTTISFWMCEDVFAKYASYDVTIVRTDSWCAFPVTKRKLAHALRV